MFIKAATLDDLLHQVISKILKTGVVVEASKGKNKEISGVLLELTQPRARLSQTETKGTIFSCLGDLLWYLSGSNELSFIEHYIQAYKKSSDDGKVLRGAYGPRIFGIRGINQYENVKKTLLEKPSSRQAVIQIFEAEDIDTKTNDVPCTCTLQFSIRKDYLHMQTYMRSNVAFIGMPHDIFAFTMLQEIMAGDLGVGLGTYKHCVGSLHIYEENLPKVRKYLDEGWQSTKVMMPPMSKRSQWPYIAQVLELEQKIRLGEQVDISSVAIDNYWADITRLLQIYALKPGQARKLIQIKNEMASPVYEEYIRKKERRVHSAKQQQLPL